MKQYNVQLQLQLQHTIGYSKSNFYKRVNCIANEGFAWKGEEESMTTVHH